MRLLKRTKEILLEGYDLYTQKGKWKEAKHHFLNKIVAQAIIDSGSTTLKQKEKATNIKQQANAKLADLFNL